MATKKKAQAPYLAEPAPDLNWAAGDAFLDSLTAANEAPAQSSFARRALGDTGIALLKGAIGVPEALVGMADLVSGGRAGKLAEDVGFRPKEAKAILDEYLSPEQQAANRAVQEAQGFFPTMAAALSNPSTIWQGAVESAPSLLPAGAVARGVGAVAPRMGAVARAAIGEGAVSGGQTAEQIRQETADGTLTPAQAGIAAASGALTGTLGAIAGKIAQQLGIGDVDTMLAGVKTSSPKVQKGVVRQIIEGAVSEGALEELPQSVQEQIAQNLALGKPLDDGLNHAAVMGMLAGGLMGGVAGPLVSHETPQGKSIRDEKVPEVGPLTKALNAATETRARHADAGMPTMTADQATVGAQARLDELAQKSEGTADEDHPGPDGEPVTITGTPGQVLTTAEREEQKALTENADNPEALARAQGATISAAAPIDPLPAMHAAAAEEAQSMRQWDRAAPKEPAATSMPESAVNRALERAGQGAATPLNADDVREAVDEANRRDAQTRELYADITRPGGAPFLNKTAATRALRATGKPDDFTVASVAGGYVLRPVLRKEHSDGGVGVASARGPAAGGGAGVADAGRSVDADGREASAPDGALSVRNGAAAAPSEDAGVAARGDDTAVATPLAGQKIDDEWMAFAPESGTKAVPRAQMPQVAAEHRGALVNFMNARGIEHEQDTEVDPATLKPTQAEFSPAKVRKARDFQGGDRSILVSSDGHVLDGHHQWVAKREAGEPVKVIVLKAPIDKLLEQIKEFPSASQSDGAPAEAAAAESAAAAEKEVTKDVAPQPEALPHASGDSTAAGSNGEVQPAAPASRPSKLRKQRKPNAAQRARAAREAKSAAAAPAAPTSAAHDVPAASRSSAPPQQPARAVVATITGNEVGDATNTAQLRRQALAWATEAIVGKTFTNEGSGVEIAVTRAGVKHGLAGANEIEVRLLAALPNLLQHGTLTATLPDKLGRADVKSVQRYEGAVKVGDEMINVGVIVRELVDGHRYYDHFALKDEAPDGTSEAAPRKGEVLGDRPASEASGDILPPPELPAASRTGAAPTPRASEIQQLVDTITKRWNNAPEVVIAENMADEAIPQAVRDEDQKQRSQGASGEPEGFYYAGKVYLLADQIGGDADVVRVLFHEALGHYGLRRTFGKDLGLILDRLAQLNPGKVRTKAREYGLDFEKQGERRAAAEEVLAEMAQATPELGWVQRAIAAIRTWLREHVPGFARMKLTDDEIVRSFILPARGWVQRGEATTIQRVASEAPAFSRSATLDLLRSATTKRGLSNLASDILESDRSFNWWHRTIGTQFQKAKADPEHFGRVYDAGQDYLHDTSAFANDTAALAPDVVPQLHGWRDVLPKALGGTGRPLTLNDADGKALAAAVFEGTLTDKQVYSPAELRARFGMNDRQIELYRQFRGSVDRSLDILAASDVARYIGEDLPAALKAMVSNGDTGRFRGLVTAFAQQQNANAVDAVKAARRDKRKRMAAMWADQKKRLEGTKPGSRLAIEQSLEEEQRKVRTEVDAAVDGAEAAAKKWADFERVTREKFERIDQLKAEGYAPLMRFGRYTVYVQGPAGEQQFFGLYESEPEAKRAARQFRESEEFQGSSVTTGVLSEEAYKQFSGMAPETIELFAEVSGVEKTPLFEEYLRRAKSNRSALKRLISRKGIEGYSEDAQRVLASFLTSNARAASANLHLGEMARLIEQIPKEKGDVKDEAIRLQEYVQNPTEEAQRLRGLLFVQYLGGSAASALVNMTQPFMMTFPYLSQFGGSAKAAGRLAGAMKAALGKPAGDLGAALARAEKEGVVSPQELHQLQAEASRSMGNHPGVRRMLFVWGSMFSLAEQFNRRVSFIAAWNTAKEQGIADPFKFASQAVDETQGVYNRGNRPNWARGALGATLFTFKQYSISYLEFMKRLPPKQRAIALLVLVLAAGAQGLPFADDLDDLIDTLGQHMGYDTNAKAWKQQLLTDAIGEGAADFALHGFSALPGFPLDVSGRLALSNLLPGTGILRKDKTDKAGEVFDMLGPVGGALRDALKGEVRPTALRNLGKSIEMFQTGEYRDSRDRKVMDVSALDAFVKGVGFQPAAVARESRNMQMANQQVQLARNVEAEIASQWAQGIADKEPEKVREAKERLAQWNRDNPRSQIGITAGQLQRRVREMRMTRQQRFDKSVPREMRSTVGAQ